MASLVSHGVLERPVIIVPVALLLLAAAGGVMWAGVWQRPVAEQAVQSHSAPSGPTMLVSTTSIARGQLLTSRDFMLAPVGASAPRTVLHRAEDAEGHMALVAIAPGMPIQPAQVSESIVPGIAAHVPEGYRAYALPVSEALTAGGFVQTGDHVDLYITLPGALFAENNAAGKQDDKSKSALLLQNILVLAVGTKTQPDGKPDTSLRTVTLALNAADLAKVSLANRLGAISLAIRNPVDAAAQPSVSPADLASLVGDHPDIATAPARKSVVPRGIPILAGRNRTVIPLP
jgi:pilus assembly protein CpaB